MRATRPVPFALLGDPVEHSLSPRLHNAAFHALGIHARYVARRVSGERALRMVRALAAAGGGGNVTLPHKQRVIATLDAPSDLVRLTGACNTFWAGPRGVHGENTDVEGFRTAAEHHGVALEGAHALLLGAGGAAAAVIAALVTAGARDIAVLNRTPVRADALVARFAASGRVRVAAGPEAGFDLVINATSLGLAPADPLPLAPGLLPPGITALDLVYAPDSTRWVRAAREQGCRAFDGAEMLLRQAAVAFRCWTGHDAPLDVMRSALFSRPDP